MSELGSSKSALTELSPLRLGWIIGYSIGLFEACSTGPLGESEEVMLNWLLKQLTTVVYCSLFT